MILSKSQRNADVFLHMERYVNCGSPSGFTDKYTTSPNTCAKGSGAGFYLCAVELPSKIAIEDYGEEPTFFNQWQMLVHPDMIDSNLFQVATKIDHKAVRVVPTASSRTVKMVDNGGWFLKLCYQGLIGRNDRQLQSEHAISAIEVSRAISAAIDTDRLPHGIYLLREVFSRVAMLPNHGSTYEWGIVLREPTPYPRNPAIEIMVPAFALFSHDEKNPNDPTVLTQLIKNQSKPAEDFLAEDIICPVYRAYFELLLCCGLQIEAHAQNILFALDERACVSGFIVRVAESVDKDFSLMDDIGLHNTFTDLQYKRLVRQQYNYSIMHSFMFDFKLGEYLVEPIIRDALLNFSLNTSALIERIRAHNKTYIERLPRDFFPQDRRWYSYANVVHDRSKKRPYVANKDPRYR